MVGMMTAKDFIDNLASIGRYCFTSEEARSALKVSPAASKLALYRLSKQGRIASPARGFHVIVPPEYRTLGCLPADQFVPDLMRHKGLAYYAGLLSAAQFHGAAHNLKALVLERAREFRPLAAGASKAAGQRLTDWKLILNAELKPDL